MNTLDLEKPPAETRVVVAMSGGVDSSVVAALLKGEGYDVVGITLQLYDDRGSAGRKGTCCAGRDIGDARAVSAKLGIPHYVLDYEARFRLAVIEPFAASYAAGETPIPCASCNDKVKFTDLLDTARSLGADALATGHYCVTKAQPSGGRGLYRGLDPSRDQSYFLFGTTPDQLAFLRFPLGELAKSRVREIAHDLGLVTADKPDSQDICFVPTGRYSDLVARLVPEAVVPGDITDEHGAVLGRHEGIVHYTVGQRRGLNLGGAPYPLFVTRIDAANARVVVGPREALQTTRLALRDVNWLGDRLPSHFDHGLDLFVRTRSAQAPVAARFHWGDTPVVTFPSAASAVSPGQACVFYESDADGRACARWGHRREEPRLGAKDFGTRIGSYFVTRSSELPGSGSSLNNTDVEAAYARWAPVYDLTFALVMRAGRKAAAAAASRPGGRVLDVGVGTGLELPMIDRRTQITGVDLSRPMLTRAKARVAAQRLTNVDGLLVMDAMNLAFQDATFDAVVAPYVLTVVPDPHASLAEWVRVLKPGGEIVLVNHVGADRGVIAAIEAWLGKRSEKLGWHPQFPWATIGDWLAARPDLRLVERRTLPPFGLFTLTRIAKL